ncbi:sensor histidine kinase [Microbacterium sp.]|uniref:sensor histidine kinase n=1 Tax=Microbacterium sp. TaxID=51671 RepID=UPI003C75F1C5
MTRSRTVVVVVAGVVVALTVASVSASVIAGWSWDTYVSSYTFTNTVVGVALAGPGLFIAWFRPRNAVGALLAVAGAGHLVSAAIAPIGTIGLAAGWPEPVTRVLATLFLVAWMIGLPALFFLALLLFPDGRLPSPRWAWLAWLIVTFTAWSVVTTAITPGPSVNGEPGTTSLFAVEGAPVAVFDVGNLIMSLTIVAAVVTSLLVRYVRGDAQTRRQLLWLILAVLAMLALNSQRWITGDGPILLLLSAGLLPVAIAIAIVRERLLDIRLVLSRTVVYGLVIAAVVALYAGLVAGLTLVVPQGADRAVAIGAAVAVALVFDPLRLLVQRAVGRLFFGTRDDPAGTAGRVGAGIGESGAAGSLEDVLHELRTALRMPRLAVTEGSRVVAVDGDGDGDGHDRHGDGDDRRGAEPRDAAHETLSLGGDVALTVTLRAGERQLHDADRRTLQLLTPAIGLLIREQRLVAELRDARAQTAEARELERKTVHRDLHDGLGPTLTSAALHLDAARNVVSAEPERAELLLAQARDDVGDALTEVRRVVYGLRPVALDGHGLVGALREQATHQAGLTVDLTVGDLPELSPAVELAAYRVAVEGIANAHRHSDGTRIAVSLTADDGTLELTVQDDGRPPSSYRPGVGIRSLTDRVEELGGTVAIGPAAEGWAVIARLPLPSS